MIRFWLERVAQLVIVIFMVSTLTFILMRVSPGDPAAILLKAHDVPASPEALASLRRQLGLTDSLWMQYIHWLRDVFTWQWGQSYVSKEPVLDELVKRLPATLELAAAGFAIMVFLTFGLGITTAIFSNGWLDRTGRFLALAGSVLPSFLLGFLLIYLFSVRLGWFPSMGRSGASNLVLPAITLGLGLGTMYARVLRANMLKLHDMPFIKAAKARGLSRSRIFIFHVLKHAVLPLLTIMGTNFAFMLGGNVIVETIFAWPGLGKYLIDAIAFRDYPVIQGYVIFATFLIVSIHLLVEAVQVSLDPRLSAQ